MDSTVLTLELLLDRSQLTERRRDSLYDETCGQVPAEGEQGSLPTDKLRQFPREENQVQDRLRCVEVETGQGLSPFLCVVGQALIRV